MKKNSTSKKNPKGFIPHYEDIAYLSKGAPNFQSGEHKNKTRKTLIPAYSAGFTFVEVIVTMFVLVAVMAAVAGIHSGLTKSNRKAVLAQRDLEQAQYALNLMAKTIRTSAIKVPAVYTSNATNIVVFDKSRGAAGECVRFQFDSTDNRLKTGSSAIAETACATAAISVGDMTGAYVSAGVFEVMPSDSINAVVGKVTIAMRICPTSACTDEARLQTTVSLRGYKEVAP